jgi:S1-C subfamily serine protease
MAYRSALVLLALGLPATAAAECVPRPWPEIFRELAEAVVTVTTVSIDPYAAVNRVRGRVGSGFLLDTEGRVLTNAHVVAGADTVVVTLGEDSAEATILGFDPVLDLAVLQVPPRPDFHPARLGHSAELRVADDVMAIGNPLSLGQTATRGIVSALDRVVPRSSMSWLAPFIQTDAAINPGSSGGPLVNACGEVVGITTGLLGAAENVGFAVPIDLAVQAMPELLEHGRVRRPWHGIFGQMVDPLLRMLADAPEIDGFLIESIEPGSAAARAGLVGGSMPIRVGSREVLLGGDIITSVDGEPLTDLATVRQIVGGLRVGQKVRIEYVRDGELRTAEVVLPERPPMPSDLRPLLSDAPVE